ncbi:MAG: hypothetical protein VX278_11275, partial [Myxococcota bacterium]|nr:hypothetical protein [Myxococcota bacterium]
GKRRFCSGLLRLENHKTHLVAVWRAGFFDAIVIRVLKDIAERTEAEEEVFLLCTERVADTIVDCLYTDQSDLIEKAFTQYAPQLDDAIRRAFEEKSTDLKTCTFAQLPLLNLDLAIESIDEMFVTREHRLHSGEKVSLCISRPMRSIENVWIAPDEKEKWRALLSCLRSNRWCPTVLEPDSGETYRDQGWYYVWYEDRARKTIYTLQYEGEYVSDSEHWQGSHDFRDAILRDTQRSYLDRKRIPIRDLLAILYFLCMRAGVSYDDIDDVVPDIGLDSDDVYTRNSSQIEGEWTICALDETVNIEEL